MKIIEFQNEYGSTIYVDLRKITHVVCMEKTTRAYFDGGDYIELPPDSKRIIEAWKIYG